MLDKKVDMLADFIIIGAMKCGTSSLYSYIASHPQIIPSIPKETNFFSRDELFNQGYSLYDDFFKNKGDFRFEASPSYSQRHIYPYTAERIHKTLPNIKIIYIVRNPVHRFYSHYIHNIANGREERLFKDILVNENNNYVLTSMYFFQLKAYLNYFPESRILVVISEHLKSKPKETMKNIFEFLGITPDYDHSLLKKHYHQSKFKRKSSPFERELMAKIKNHHIKSAITRFKCMFSSPLKYPNLTESDRSKLYELFENDISNLRRFTGYSLDNWEL